MATLTSLDAVTERHFIPTVIDQAFLSNPTFFRLWNEMRTADGGTEIVLPVMLTTPTAAGSYAGADVFITDFTDNNFGAEFPWASYYATISVTGEDNWKNMGPEAAVNLLEVRCKQADTFLRQTLGSDLQGDGTGNGGKAILGFKAAIDDGTNVNVYANINRTTFTNWKSNLSANGGVGRAVTLDLVNQNFMNASRDNIRPNMIVTTRAIYSKFLTLLQPNQRFDSDKTFDAANNSYNIGYTNILYQNRPIVVDEQVSTSPLHLMWFFNTNFMHLYVQNSRKFEYMPFMRYQNQDAATAQILVSLQLVTESPRTQSQVRDLDPTL